MMSRTLQRAAAVFALALGAASCDDPTSIRYGQLDLFLTDAPGDVVSAVVTIDRIYLQPSEESDEGRLILREDDITVDLLTLADATAELVMGATIPVGEYSQLRFVISGAYVAVEEAGGGTKIYASAGDYVGLPEGATVGGTLVMPSLAYSGLKINLPRDAIVIAEDETVTVVVDFDVAASFGAMAGASGNWVMTPVINALSGDPALGVTSISRP